MKLIIHDQGRAPSVLSLCRQENRSVMSTERTTPSTRVGTTALCMPRYETHRAPPGRQSLKEQARLAECLPCLTSLCTQMCTPAAVAYTVLYVCFCWSTLPRLKGTAGLASPRSYPVQAGTQACFMSAVKAFGISPCGAQPGTRFHAGQATDLRAFISTRRHDHGDTQAIGQGHSGTCHAPRPAHGGAGQGVGILDLVCHPPPATKPTHPTAVL